MENIKDKLEEIIDFEKIGKIGDMIGDKIEFLAEFVAHFCNSRNNTVAKIKHKSNHYQIARLLNVTLYRQNGGKKADSDISQSYHIFKMDESHVFLHSSNKKNAL